jgi:hypothetical protein
MQLSSILTSSLCSALNVRSCLYGVYYDIPVAQLASFNTICTSSRGSKLPFLSLHPSVPQPDDIITCPYATYNSLSGALILASKLFSLRSDANKCQHQWQLQVMPVEQQQKQVLHNYSQLSAYSCRTIVLALCCYDHCLSGYFYKFTT